MTVAQLVQKYIDPVTGLFKNNAPAKAINASLIREWVQDFGLTLQELSASLPATLRTDWLALNQFAILTHGAGAGVLADSQPGYSGLLQLNTNVALGGAHVNSAKLLMEKSLLMQTVLFLPALSTVGESFYYRFGLFADLTVRNQVNGIYLEYSHDINGGQWVINSYKAGVLVQTLTTIPVAINTRYELTLLYSAASGVAISINGVIVATVVNINLPLAVPMNYGNGIRKYNGALNRNVLIDSDLLVYNLAQ